MQGRVLGRETGTSQGRVLGRETGTSQGRVLARETGTSQGRVLARDTGMGRGHTAAVCPTPLGLWRVPDTDTIQRKLREFTQGRIHAPRFTRFPIMSRGLPTAAMRFCAIIIFSCTGYTLVDHSLKCDANTIFFIPALLIYASQ